MHLEREIVFFITLWLFQKYDSEGSMSDSDDSKSTTSSMENMDQKINLETGFESLTTFLDELVQVEWHCTFSWQFIGKLDHMF